MAFRAFLIAIFIAAAVAPALATDYMVGDDKGWASGVNYTEWAQGKDFRVGDTLSIAPALATDYIIGDNAFWTLGVNYTVWTEGKDFRVGDTLMFMYKPGSHNVLSVNGDDFEKCTSSNVSAVPLMSGHDVIPLTSPGKKWYICDIGDHCSRGMKLVITVSAAEGPIPSPTPGTSPAVEVSPWRSCAWMVAMMAVYRMIMA
ncbi:hypothetical protein CDL12_09050 [Handroanthus impetiginosus]|uniref:Phytocyanin domain-containing protein n=1 Tax=Handroanthus impetiginosus TaxID=429701 RepID=A0A2G9HLU4_9LAMI|nr:hypothetical protein CDL12_09050 [Handroanthus impetiginosus]